ncbi:MAG: hypothetical protein IJW99_03605 [Clostridia bacterium]|nr:hypothetical protein [Clostridia bacterium]
MKKIVVYLSALLLLLGAMLACDTTEREVNESAKEESEVITLMMDQTDRIYRRHRKHRRRFHITTEPAEISAVTVSPDPVP